MPSTEQKSRGPLELAQSAREWLRNSHKIVKLFL
jgi:hypothetical protein